MRNAIPNFRKTIVIISSVFIAILLISTATAVPQIHGSIAVKKIKKYNIFPSFIDLKNKNYLKILSDKNLAEKTRANIYLLIQKIKDRLKNIIGERYLDNKEKEKIVSGILTFFDKILENKDKLKSSTIFNELKESLKKDKKQYNNIFKARSLLQSILQALGLYSKKIKGEMCKIARCASEDIEKLIYILNNLKSTGKEKIRKSLENILSHYNSDTFSKIKGFENGNLTKIILIILAIVAIFIVIGILIWLLPFLAPLIQLFLMALAPLIVLLAIAVIVGGILGLALIIIGLIILLIAFIVGLNLAIAIVFAIIILIVISLIILSIALTAIGLFIAGLGCIVGGFIAASPILLPVLLTILSIILVVNIVLGGAILSTVYGLIEKYNPSLAETIRSLCETLYNIPALGPILAFLLPGLPWPGTEHKKIILPRLTMLVTLLMQKMIGKKLPRPCSTL